MKIIISLVILVFALVLLRWLTVNIGIEEEIRVWVTDLKNTQKHKLYNVDRDYDWYIIRYMIGFIVCNIIFIFSIIWSITDLNCFSILKIYLSLLGFLYTIYSMFSIPEKLYNLLNNIFDHWLYNKILGIFVIILLYTLLIHFRKYYVDIPHMIIPVFIVQVICWDVCFALMKKKD